MKNERIASIDSVAEEDCVTVKTKYGELTLQIDTIATCNVVPMHTYIALTKDKELRLVEKSKIQNRSHYLETKPGLFMGK